MSTFLIRLPLATAILAGSASSTTPSARGSVQETPDLVAVEKGTFTVVLDLKGSFDQADAHEVAARPAAYKGTLEVLEAAAPGPVKAGQTLVRLDPEELDRQLEKARLDLAIAKANFERQSQQAQHKEESAAIAFESAKRSFETSKRTFETYRDVLMPMRLAEAELSLQSSKNRMKDEEAQFEQLQKMYKSDDLVEETEEIVLNRARRGLEQQRERMKFSLQRHRMNVEHDIPRELENHAFSLRKATNDFELAKATATLSLEQSRAELEKAKLALDKQIDDLRRLEEDRGALTIAAPCDGLGVRGVLAKGKWSGLSEDPKGLEPETKISANQVLYTIVQFGPDMIRTTVVEASVLDVKAGQKAVVTPVATPDSRLSATVHKVARISANGSYDVWLQVDQKDSRLLPGHACEIELTALEVENAMSVPSSAVKEDGERKIVHVWKNDEAVQREVEVGRSSKGRVQILSGISVNDHVVKDAASVGSK